MIDTTRRQKAEHAIRSFGKFDNLKTLVIMSGENPGIEPFDKYNTSKLEKDLESELDENYHPNYRYFKVKGLFEGFKENSLMIYNLDLLTAKRYASKYGQYSFIFCRFTDIEDNKVVCEYYEVELKNGKPVIDNSNNSYVYNKIKEEYDFTIITDEYNNLTLVSKNFKFRIPFKFMDSINKRMSKQAKLVGDSYNELLQAHLKLVANDKDKGRAAYYMRARIYGNNK